MKQLWAPWRLDYIKSAHDDEALCIFCEALKPAPRDALLLHSTPLSLIIMNRYPYSNGHLLVSPKRHISRLDELAVDEAADIMRLLAHSTTVLTKTMNPDGFNTGANLGRAAGAGIDGHIHFHVVPRWSGDSNFMAVLSEIRVIPEHIERTFELLEPHFKGL
jgi:ATP adenylyltransferase